MYTVFEHLLQERNVSPYQVSKATGVSQTTLSSWKTRNSEPTASTLKKIADYFGVSVDYLLTGDELKRDPYHAAELFPFENREFMYSRAEALHGMIADLTRNGDSQMIELLYTFIREDWSEDRIRLLIGYATKLSEDAKSFMDMWIERELRGYDDNPETNK